MSSVAVLGIFLLVLTLKWALLILYLLLFALWALQSLTASVELSVLCHSDKIKLDSCDDDKASRIQVVAPCIRRGKRMLCILQV